jgi:hypothetical protein
LQGDAVLPNKLPCLRKDYHSQLLTPNWRGSGILLRRGNFVRIRCSLVVGYRCGGAVLRTKITSGKAIFLNEPTETQTVLIAQDISSQMRSVCQYASQIWRQNGTHLKTEVTAGSNRSVWWQCQAKLTHEWQATIDAVVRLHKGGTSGCPYCYGLKASPENNFLAKYPEIAAQWHSRKNLPLQSRQITPGSDKLVWWFCPKGSAHVWQARVKDFVKCKRNGTSGCPHCRPKVKPKSLRKCNK